jgi:hypothetical protein
VRVLAVVTGMADDNDRMPEPGIAHPGSGRAALVTIVLAVCLAAVAGCAAPDMPAAHRLLTGWAFQLPGWKTGQSGFWLLDETAAHPLGSDSTTAMPAVLLSAFTSPARRLFSAPGRFVTWARLGQPFHRGQLR